MNLIKPPKKRRLIQSWRSYYRWFVRARFDEGIAILLGEDGEIYILECDRKTITEVGFYEHPKL